MLKVKIVQSDKGQVILLPDKLKTKREELDIRASEDFFILSPTEDPWLPVKQVVGTFPEDFMNDRKQPSWDEVTERVSF